ncbi:IS607 family element RNA-guided endonuclease TnpB [Bifidobacterium callitrichidarum]|uniref:Transposase n=1 Tax=Bifidobacterium callitrichidarum TaxID=2052941 RepID=A0A2U2N0X3_9BIFI|nr:IS607 family element RNA-guided endonuclease TnpB [Bifidobacterium callitrichidarum]PWG62639.1 transposase [Bifidobacterium callitrichidarum]
MAEGRKKRRKYEIPEGKTIRGVKVALDPTPRQAGLLSSNAGAARFAYNTALAHISNQLDCVEPAPSSGKADWSMRGLRNWWNRWKNDLAPWWAGNSKEAYNSGFQALSDAFRNYFDWLNGDREGEPVGWPKYKSKHKSTWKYTYTTGFGLIDGDDRAVRLPCVGRVHCMENVRKCVGDGRILSVTVRYEHNRWWASLRVEKDQPPQATGLSGSVGADLGVKTLVTLSNGIVIPNPRYLKQTERKLERQQKRLSRRQPGSRRYAKKKRQVNKLYAHVANQRLDLRHKTTTWMANTYADIGIEDLNVKGMTARPKPKEDPNNPGHYLKNGAKAKSSLNKAILDAGFGDFRRQLEYKCQQTGSRLHVYDRFYPSSKTCSNCGTVKTKLPLSERVFHCDNCGIKLDRDRNAANNLDPVGSTPARNVRGETQRGLRKTNTPVGRKRIPCRPTERKTRSRIGNGNPMPATQQTEL